jgi:hypothetical protein
MEPGVQTPEETLTKRSRLLPRFGWLLVQLLRHLGLAARFVSGYLIQLTPDVKSLDGRPEPNPTSPTCTPGARCTCRAPAGSGSTRPPACSPARGTFRWRARPKPSSAAPVTGMVDECECTFEHHMQVDAASGRRRA